MKTVLLHEHEGLRTFALVLATGEEVMSTVTSFATARQLRATQFTAIGALSRVVRRLLRLGHTAVPKSFGSMSRWKSSRYWET